MFILVLLIVLAVVLTVGFSELVKKLDRGEKLKTFRAWIPVLISAFFAFLLWSGAFFAGKEFWCLWALIFSLSILCYESIIKNWSHVFLKKIKQKIVGLLWGK